MTKALIYKDDKSTLVFCEGNKIYLKTPTSSSYIEARNLISQLEQHKFIKGKFKDKVDELKKLLSMDYKAAAKFYLRTCKAKNKEGKLFEGEFNEN